MDFIGSISFSENLAFAVAYADSCRAEDGSLHGGSRPSGEGDVLLLKEKRLVWQSGAHTSRLIGSVTRPFQWTR
jgi:hypothetical protein